MRLGAGTFAACCVLVEVLGVALFLRGFFPAPVRSSRTEQRAEPPAPEPSAGASSNWTKLPPPLFGKVVMMLIDGLRDDFVFGSKGVKFMPYTTYLVEKGASHSFVAEAKLPTVTMPRIKALMTGSLPGFIDVVRNLNSPALLEDNVITQAKAAGKRIIFYGDETWVKLFPKHFVEYDGTASFFVSDYTEVDDNVTRHLDKVLKRADWDMLILHYLGLDHIGHVSGPSSPLIGHKLQEMDSVLMKIHTSLLSEERETLVPNLLVLCGDHGMSEAGGHGASSVEELNTALVLISSAFERKPGDVRRPKHVQQTDLAATLAVGLGLPIPENSVGSLLFPAVEGRPVREQLRFLHLNAVQLSKLLQENMPSYTKGRCSPLAAPPPRQWPTSSSFRNVFVQQGSFALRSCLVEAPERRGLCAHGASLPGGQEQQLSGGDERFRHRMYWGGLAGRSPGLRDADGACGRCRTLRWGRVCTKGDRGPAAGAGRTGARQKETRSEGHGGLSGLGGALTSVVSWAGSSRSLPCRL